MLTSIIIPVFNEEETIIRCLEQVHKQKKVGNKFEIIVVNDGSSDNTLNLLNENINLIDILISLEKNSGKGFAVKKGIEASNGELVLIQDADLEYSPTDYQKLFKPIIDFDAEVVMGSRFLAPEFTRVHYFWNKIGNRLITLIFNVLFNTTFTDIYCCYILFKKDLLNSNKLREKRWSQHAEILAKVVKKADVIYEVPVSYSGRTYDEGKKIRAIHVVGVVKTIIKNKII